MTHGQPSNSLQSVPSRFQRWEWRVRLFARAVFFIFLLTAALGLFGRGPLARASLTVEGVECTYDRFLRNEGSFGFRLPAASATVELRAEGIFEPEDRIVVEPGTAQTLTGGGVRTFIVPVEEGRSVEVRLTWEPARCGPRRGRFVVGSAILPVRAVAYP